jgi:hypothetical protein
MDGRWSACMQVRLQDGCMHIDARVVMRMKRVIRICVCVLVCAYKLRAFVFYAIHVYIYMYIHICTHNIHDIHTCQVYVYIRVHGDDN